MISLLYVLFFNYVLGGGSLGLDYMILLALLLIGPWKVIISLYRSGVRLPFVYGGGIIGITIMLIELVVLVGLPVVVGLSSRLPTSSSRQSSCTWLAPSK